MQENKYYTYDFSVRSDRLDNALVKTASILYLLIQEELSCRDVDEAEECDFEEFARDIMGVLACHADRIVTR
jgi:hypothetical protein